MGVRGPGGIGAEAKPRSDIFAVCGVFLMAVFASYSPSVPRVLNTMHPLHAGVATGSQSCKHERRRGHITSSAVPNSVARNWGLSTESWSRWMTGT